MNRGWGAPLALTLIAAALSVVNPGLLLFIPFALALLALPPRRPGLMLLGVVLLLFTFVTRPGTDALWWVGRGWALLLGAWFIMAVALRPGRAFIDQALLSVFGAAGTAAALLLVVRAGWTNLDAAVSERLRQSAESASAQWAQLLKGGTPAVQTDVAATMQKAAELQALLYPALLGLASLCALGVAWHLWRRMAVRDAQPLNRLREFRFRDELIWLVVLSIALLVLPLNALATRTGTNLAAFMGALYAVRGLAIAISLFGAPGPLGLVLGAVAMLFLFPMVAAGTLVLGLSDTWLDLRSKAQTNQPQP